MRQHHPQFTQQHCANVRRTRSMNDRTAILTRFDQRLSAIGHGTINPVPGLQSNASQMHVPQPSPQPSLAFQQHHMYHTSPTAGMGMRRHEARRSPTTAHSSPRPPPATLDIQHTVAHPLHSATSSSRAFGHSHANDPRGDMAHHQTTYPHRGHEHSPVQLSPRFNRFPQPPVHPHGAVRDGYGTGTRTGIPIGNPAASASASPSAGITLGSMGPRFRANNTADTSSPEKLHTVDNGRPFGSPAVEPRARGHGQSYEQMPMTARYHHAVTEYSTDSFDHSSYNSYAAVQQRQHSSLASFGAASEREVQALFDREARLPVQHGLQHRDHRSPGFDSGSATPPASSTFSSHDRGTELQDDLDALASEAEGLMAEWEAAKQRRGSPTSRPVVRHLQHHAHTGPTNADHSRAAVHHVSPPQRPAPRAASLGRLESEWREARHQYQVALQQQGDSVQQLETALRESAPGSSAVDAVHAASLAVSPSGPASLSTSPVQPSPVSSRLKELSVAQKRYRAQLEARKRELEQQLMGNTGAVANHESAGAERAATLLQAATRRRQSQVYVRNKMQQRDAVVAVQSVYRSHASRKGYQKQEQQRNASVAIHPGTYNLEQEAWGEGQGIDKPPPQAEHQPRVQSQSEPEHAKSELRDVAAAAHTLDFGSSVTELCAARKLQTIFRGKQARRKGMEYTRIFTKRGPLGIDLYKFAVLSVKPNSQAEAKRVIAGSIVLSVNYRRPLHPQELDKMLTSEKRPLRVTFLRGGDRSDMSEEAVQAAVRVAAAERIQTFLRGTLERSRGLEYEREFDQGRLGMNIDGLTVVRVVPGGKAAEQGVRVGSRITGINGERVSNGVQLALVLRATQRPIRIRFACVHVDNVKEGILYRMTASSWKRVFVCVEDGQLGVFKNAKARKSKAKPNLGGTDASLDLSTCWVDETDFSFKEEHSKFKHAEFSFRVVSEIGGAQQQSMTFAVTTKEDKLDWLTFLARVCASDGVKSDIETLEEAEKARDAAAARLQALFHGMVARAKGIEYVREFGDGRLGLELDGVNVNRVVPGGQAAEQSVIAGSRIIAVNGTRVKDAMELAMAIRSTSRPLSIRFTRLGLKRTKEGELHQLSGSLSSLKWKRAFAQVTERGELVLRAKRGAKPSTTINLSSCWVNETSQEFRARHTAPHAEFSFQVVGSEGADRTVLVLAGSDRASMLDWTQLFDRLCGDQKLGPTLEEMEEQRAEAGQRIQALLRGRVARMRGLEYEREFDKGDLGFELRSGLIVNRLCPGGQAEQREVFVGSRVLAVDGFTVADAFALTLRLTTQQRPIKIRFTRLQAPRTLSAELHKLHKGKSWKLKQVQLHEDRALTCVSTRKGKDATPAVYSLENYRVENTDDAFVAKHSAAQELGDDGAAFSFRLVPTKGSIMVFACPSADARELWTSTLSRVCGKQPPPESFESKDAAATGPVDGADDAGRQRAALRLTRFIRFAAAMMSGREYNHVFLNDDDMSSMELAGLYVHSVNEKGPAHGVVRKGSRIIAVNGVGVNTKFELQLQLQIAKRPLKLRFAVDDNNQPRSGQLFKLSGGVDGTAWKPKTVEVDAAGMLFCRSQTSKKPKSTDELPLAQCRVELLEPGVRKRHRRNGSVDASSIFVITYSPTDGTAKSRQLVLGAAHASEAERWLQYISLRCGQQGQARIETANLQNMKESKGEETRQRNKAAQKLQGWLRGVVARSKGLEYERVFGAGLLGIELQGLTVHRTVRGTQSERMGVAPGSVVVSINGNKPSNAMDAQVFIKMAKRPFKMVFSLPPVEKQLDGVLHKLSGSVWKEKYVSVDDNGVLKCKSLKTEYVDTVRLAQYVCTETDSTFRKQHQGTFALANYTLRIAPTAQAIENAQVEVGAAKGKGSKSGKHLPKPLVLAMSPDKYFTWLRTLNIYCMKDTKEAGAGDGVSASRTGQGTALENKAAAKLQSWLRGVIARKKGLMYDVVFDSEGSLGMEMSGLNVTRVIEGGAAAKAGVVRGSRIVKISDRNVNDVMTLVASMKSVGRPLKMTLLRFAQQRSRTGTLFKLEGGINAKATSWCQVSVHVDESGRLTCGEEGKENGGSSKAKGKTKTKGKREGTTGAEPASLKLAECSIKDVSNNFVRYHARQFEHAEFAFQLVPHGATADTLQQDEDTKKGKKKKKQSPRFEDCGGWVFAASDDASMEDWWLWFKMRCGKRSSVDTQNLEGFASQDRQEQAASVIARFIRFASVQKRLSKQLGGKVGVAGAVAGQLASPKKPKDRRSKAAAKARADDVKVKQAERRHHHRRRSSCAAVAM